ncbi:MAG: hypothetical protein COV34_02785 [Candidatus Zambryskibacteria bacterium CG10_big_fil_rev_8_21_14_0_10_42_12]|uniref:General secretion pathway GspH domain-containing protein n=1 Tax=Candidatus Zambryskibacteria bacterium CG10_big_fil_rev_8_21_14_0_10_42_12 TaxID=1975115 RepID=A0A2H0QUM7_9BACT|nr:MAG: hypothetical protein COV34_02785 [Candidatus Zambryskibacteria bacterium CG10_big_fil_rev_8_21_14_0_10_42_12]
MKRGFTLLEILITLGIIGLLAFIGIITGVDTYKRYLTRSDIDSAAVLLQKARSSAINNIGNTSHGVHVGNTGEFVLFRGNSYASRDTTYDLVIEQNKDIAISGLSEVVFSQISGETTAGTITVTSDTGNITININSEGGINW